MDPAVNHLQRLAYGTQFICPPLSRYFFERSVKYVCNRNERQKIENNILFSRCLFCYNGLKPGNNSIKLSPKPRFTRGIKRLMKNVEQKQKKIGKYQKKLIQDYINKPNKLVIVCSVCKKSRDVKCQSRLERQTQKKSVEERTLQTQEEIPVVEPIKSRRSKKKERRKLLRQKHRHGDLDDDKNAGLLLPTSDTVLDEEQEKSKIEPEFRIESENEDKEEAIHAAGSKTASLSGKKNNVGKCNVEANANIQQEHHSLSNIACKPSPKKTSGTANCDLNRISSIIDDRKVTMTVKGQKSNGLKGDLFMTGKNQKSVADKKNKAKKMSQQLSRMLKQEKNKSSGGSLTDFLSSL